MKNIRTYSILIACVLLSFKSYAKHNYPFDVKITGQGKSAVILIPGFACSGEVWDATKTLFEKDHTCYTLTMDGFAGVPAQEPCSFSAWENGIAEFITENKIDHPVVIGHSMGGGLAMALAADHPDLISKIVVVDALPCLGVMMDSSFKVETNPDNSAMVAQFTAMTDSQFYQMQKSSITGLLADSSKQEQVVQWSMHSDRKTMAEMFADFMNTDLREKIRNIKCPALILLEPYFAYSKPAIDAQFKNLSTADIRYATKGLHFIMYDDQAWFETQLIGFVGH